MFVTRLVLAAPLMAAFALPAWAAGPTEVATQAAPVVQSPAVARPDLVLNLRGGIASTPDYFGSGDYTLGPDLSLGFSYLRLPGGRSIGDPDPTFRRDGVGLRASFRYIDQRDDDDNPELQGLDDIDVSAELGLGLGYESRRFDAFADLRYGVVGHNTFVGELGADVKANPTDRLTLSAGPRLLLGTDRYVDTYFGVTPGASAASGGDFAAYDPGGGIVSAGVELGLTYRINQNWGVEGAVSYDRFVGDAADSPIVEQGERDQYGVRLGVTRRIVLDF